MQQRGLAGRREAGWGEVPPRPPPSCQTCVCVPTVNTAGACPGKTVLPSLFYHLYHYCVLWIDWHESSRKLDWHIVFMVSINRKGNDLYDASLLPLCSIYDILSYSILGSIPLVVTFANSTAGLVCPAPSQAVNPFMRFPMMACPTPYIYFLLTCGIDSNSYEAKRRTRCWNLIAAERGRVPKLRSYVLSSSSRKASPGPACGATPLDAVHNQ